jgi:hypothetical protein
MEKMLIFIQTFSNRLIKNSKMEREEGEGDEGRGRGGYWSEVKSRLK